MYSILIILLLLYLAYPYNYENYSTYYLRNENLSCKFKLNFLTLNFIYQNISNVNKLRKPKCA